jgi:outer membrane protein OmpA-like peptidoglycan-associated protein
MVAPSLATNRQSILERTPPPDLNGEWRSTSGAAASADRIMIQQLDGDVIGIQLSAGSAIPAGEIRSRGHFVGGEVFTIEEACPQSNEHPAQVMRETVRALDDTRIRFEGGCDAGTVWSRYGSTTISIDAADLFQFNSSALAPGAAQILDRLVDMLELRPLTSAMVLGFTDNLGTSQHNLQLSTRRARAVANWLEGHHTWQFRIGAKGMGAQNPRYPNSTEQGRTHNRRIEIVIEP